MIFDYFKVKKEEEVYKNPSDKIIIEKVIKKIEDNLDDFTTLDKRKSMNNYFINKDGTVMVMSEYLHIVRPKNIIPIKKHLDELRILADKIIERDTEKLIDGI